ncbi:MAG: sugar ABC transporter permease [Actinomyces urogenitalis]|nr:sugar ABC transporter permease [Actinomyces urogenitalis]
MNKAKRRRAVACMFLIPLALVNVTVIVGPTIATVAYSFTDWTGLGVPDFVGVSNYIEIIHDVSFWQAFIHNLEWMAVFLTVPIFMGLAGAYLLMSVRRGRSIYQAIYFIPYMIASVVNASIWQNILSPNRGIGTALANAGVPWLKDVAFFGDRRLALGAVAFVDNWHWWGFVAVLFFTAMQAVDPSLYEAAELDGAGRWKQFLHVTIPSIRPTLMFVLLLSIVWSLLTFDYVYIITQGGPSGATELVSTLLYRAAFSEFRAGYAAALGVTMMALSAVVICGYQYLTRKRGWDV